MDIMMISIFITHPYLKERICSPRRVESILKERICSSRKVVQSPFWIGYIVGENKQAVPKVVFPCMKSGCCGRWESLEVSPYTLANQYLLLAYNIG